MRQLFRSLFSLSLLLILLVACKTQELPEEVTLELSTTSLTFAKGGSEQTLTVTTNRSHWTATSPQEADWVVLTQEGNTLKVRAKANQQGQDRLGSVIVNAGGEQRRVTLRQSASEVLLDLGANRVTFLVEGGQETLTYYANVEELKVELATPESWLSVDSRIKGRISITAQPNEGEAQRTAKINLTAGTLVREIEVVQNGSIQYILPLQKFPASLQDVIRFERSRFSEHTRTRERGEAVLFRYATQSTLMPLLEYEFENERSRGYQAAITLCLDDKYLRDNVNFAAFLKANGYEKDNALTTAEQDVYTNKTLPLNLNVAYDPSGQALLETVYMPRQSKDYPTFSKIPLEDRIPLGSFRSQGIHGKTKDEIRAQEVTWGGTLDDVLSNTSYDRFKATKSLEGEAVRGYFYVVKDATKPQDDPYVGEVSSVQSVFTDLSKAFWMDALGRSYLTKEFLTLLNDGGYSYIRTFDGGYIAFYNATKQYAYIVHQAVTEGKPSIEIQAYKLKLQSSGNARTLLQRGNAGYTLLDRRRELIRQIQLRLDQTRRLQGLR